MSIVFKKISYKNFLSVGNIPVVVELDRAPTTLITAPNGSGKSTLTDALTFVLFDKSYRGIRKGQMVNSINKKHLEVEIEFSNGSVGYKIIRCISPNKFEIYKNGKLVDEAAATRDYQQYLETQILGFNYKAFIQTCILGTANYTPFMQLSTSNRRNVIETLFGINVFSTMNNILKGRVSVWKKSVEDLSKDIESYNVQYSMQKEFVESFQSSNDEKIDAKKNQMADIKAKVIEAKKKEQEHLEYASKLDLHKAAADASSKELSSLESQLRSLKKTHSQLQAKITELKNKAGGECHACLQQVNDSHIETCTKSMNQEITGLEPRFEELESKITQARSDYDDALAEYHNSDSHNKSLLQVRAGISQLAEVGKGIVEEIRRLSESTDVQKLEEAKTKLVEISALHKDSISKKKELMLHEEAYKLSLSLLKDTGIKSVIVGQYLPILNQRVNHYLSLLNFNVKFELDENFNETLKSRNRTEFAYSNFSQGEKQRIDVALLFAWRDIASMKNSVNCNLLIMDETMDASLDGNGTDDLLDIIQDQRNVNIFIVSHKNNLEEKLFSTLRFEKINGFTRLV